MAVTLHEGSRTATGTYYERYGLKGSVADRPALVFVHGVGMNCHVWEPQARAFEEVYDVVTYDTLGHGKSPLPDHDAQLEDYVTQLYNLIESLQLEKVHIVGHSMGALIAIAFALKHGERVLSLTAMMGVYDRTAEHRARSRSTAKLLEKKGPGATLEATFSRWFSKNDHTIPDKAKKIAQIREWLSEMDPLGYARAYRVFAANGDNFVGRLGSLTAPALFLTAEADPNSTPRMSETMAAAAPKGRLCILEGERHMAPYLAADAVNRELGSFLTEVSASACKLDKTAQKEAAL